MNKKLLFSLFLLSPSFAFADAVHPGEVISIFGFILMIAAIIVSFFKIRTSLKIILTPFVAIAIVGIILGLLVWDNNREYQNRDKQLQKKQNENPLRIAICKQDVAGVKNILSQTPKDFFTWERMGSFLMSCGTRNKEINILVMKELSQNQIYEQTYSDITMYGYCDVLAQAQANNDTDFLKSLEVAGLPTKCETQTITGKKPLSIEQQQNQLLEKRKQENTQYRKKEYLGQKIAQRVGEKEMLENPLGKAICEQNLAQVKNVLSAPLNEFTKKNMGGFLLLCIDQKNSQIAELVMKRLQQEKWGTAYNDDYSYYSYCDVLEQVQSNNERDNEKYFLKSLENAGLPIKCAN